MGAFGPAIEGGAVSARPRLEPTASRSGSERFQHTHSDLAGGAGITEVGEKLG